MKSLYIKNYKSFNELTIPKLSRVNLIWGLNNTGKSTILEAVSLSVSKGSLFEMYKILNVRGEDVSALQGNRDVTIRDEVNSLLPLVTNFSVELLSQDGLTIGESKIDNTTLKLVKRYRIPSDRENAELTDSYTIKTIPYYEDPEEISYVDCYPALKVENNPKSEISYIQFSGQGLRSNLLKRSFDIVPCKYMSSRSTQFEDIDELWNAISMTEYEKYVLDALRIIEPQIVRFNVLSEKKSSARPEFIPYVLLDGTDRKMRLSAMGDGINRVVMIILSLINCRNGYFLLDEFENGLHYTVQLKLWNIIFELAEKLNVQVFVTTHSNDCIGSFAKVALQKNEGKAIRMDRMTTGIKSQLYENMNDLLFAIQSGIELR